jgi:4-amino-4-deoxy-L-arabinose transferase-like glycosyltransferase
LTRNDYLWLLGIATVVAVVLLFVIDEPGYLDAYYYYNAAQRLADGHGLTDPYLWNFLYTPDKLPVPSHTYWMPLTSLLMTASMTVFGTSVVVAQLPTVLALILLTVTTAWLGYRLGKTRRHAWLSALLVLAGGFYLPRWVMTDSFAIFGLLGMLSLITMGIGREKMEWRWFAACGALSGLAHLTRADGLLLALVALIVIWYPRSRADDETSDPPNPNMRLKLSVALIATYLLVMLPWFIRNMNVIDSPLPSGGINTAFLRGYNELFAYPVDWSAGNFLDWGFSNMLQSRSEALLINFLTFIAVETWVILSPLVLWALWKHRKQPLLFAVGLYALGLHLAMTFVFAYPGFRGGLFHSASALLSFWAVLGVMGLDDAIDGMVRLRNWNRDHARLIFGGSLIFLSAILGLNALVSQIGSRDEGPDYENLATYLPDDAVLMVNDPAAWYYHTGYWGVTLPDAPLDRLPEIAGKYCLTHIIIDKNVTDSFEPLIYDGEVPPLFLEQIQHINQDTETTDDDVRLYRFRPESITYADTCPTPTPPSN